MEQRGESWRETARSVAEVMGLGAKRLTDAARRQIELSDLRAGINAALRELGELLGVSRSGINHRLQKISQLAKQARDEEICGGPQKK